MRLASCHSGSVSPSCLLPFSEASSPMSAQSLKTLHSICTGIPFCHSANPPPNLLIAKLPTRTMSCMSCLLQGWWPAAMPPCMRPPMLRAGRQPGPPALATAAWQLASAALAAVTALVLRHLGSQKALLMHHLRSKLRGYCVVARSYTPWGHTIKLPKSECFRMHGSYSGNPV